MVALPDMERWLLLRLDNIIKQTHETHETHENNDGCIIVAFFDEFWGNTKQNNNMQ